jgi:hypothetical protein
MCAGLSPLATVGEKAAFDRVIILLPREEEKLLWPEG